MSTRVSGTMLPGDFNDGGEEPTRRQRQRMVQTGLLIAFMLLLLDQRQAEDAADRAIQPSQSPLNRVGIDSLKSTLWDPPTDVFFPPVTTGFYRGTWERVGSEKISTPLPSGIVYPPPDAGAPAKPEREGGEITMSSDKGGIVFSIISQPLEELAEDVSLVHGLLKIVDGTGGTLHDPTFNLQGVYYHRYGRLTAVAGTGGSDLKLVWDKIQVAHNTPQPTTLGTRRDRTLTLDAEAFMSQSKWRRLYERFGSKGWLDMMSYRRKNSERVLTPDVENVDEESTMIVHIGGNTQNNTTTQMDIEVDINTLAPDNSIPQEGVQFRYVPGIAWPLNAETTQEQISLPVPIRVQPLGTQSTANGKGCVFTINFQTTGPIGTIDAPLSEDKIYVQSMEGEMAGVNCDFYASMSVTAERVDWNTAYPKAINYSVALTITCLIEIGLLFKQLFYSQTQAAAARVSLLCIGQQAILDALLCITHLLLCAIMQPLFVAFATVAFFKLITFCILEMRYIILIFQARQPQSFFEGGWASMRRELAGLHGKFYIGLATVLIVIWIAPSWFYTIVFCLYGFWVPQIVHNARTGVRNPLHRAYLFGMSTARLLIPLYIFGCPSNFFRVVDEATFEIRYDLCIALVVWVGLQVSILVAQDKFGPQFFIPRQFLAPKYDYRRAFPHNNISSTSTLINSNIQGGGLEAGASPDCTICYFAVDQHEDNYLVCPCDHTFHEACLVPWMEIKMECPTCRQPLPPYP